MMSSENNLLSIFSKFIEEEKAYFCLLLIFISFFVNFNRYFYISENLQQHAHGKKCLQLLQSRYIVLFKCIVDFRLASTFFCVELVIDMVTAACCDNDEP